MVFPVSKQDLSAIGKNLPNPLLTIFVGLTHIDICNLSEVSHAEKKASDGCIDFRAPQMRVSCVGACEAEEKRWLPGRLADVQLTQSAPARRHFRTAQPAIMGGGQRPSKVMEARARTGLSRGWHLVGF